MGEALQIHRVAAGAMARRTVAVVSGWLQEGGPPGQIAVLARVNSALLPVQVALGEADVPATAPLDANVLRRTGIRAAMAYLRIGQDPERIRREDLWATINRPTRRLKSACQPLLQQSRRWSMAQLEQAGESLQGSRGERFEGYLADLRLLADAFTGGADTKRCLGLIRDEVGLGEAMDALDSSTTRPQGSSHGDDLDALEQLAALHPDPVTFRDWLAGALDRPGQERGVVLSTVHRVKGMEWDRVVVFAANDGLMPHRLADDLEEERRVFHVALTRARRAAAVIGDEARASPFVDELARRPEPRPDEAADEQPRSATPRPAGEGSVAADPGLAVTLPGGFPGRVVSVGDGHAQVLLQEVLPDGEQASVEVPLGTPVAVDGTRRRLAAPPATTPVGRYRTTRLGAQGPDGGNSRGDEAEPADPALLEQLRDWRSRTARQQDVPAYVVLHDAHLEAIASRRPTTDRELARCPGIGPTRLERYGDDLLAIVADGDG